MLGDYVRAKKLEICNFNVELKTKLHKVRIVLARNF
ncbi:MAG: hypothetical protein ACJAUH_002262 [Saprospiraceae bacterium]|jgi:hypothetical protein